MAASAAAAGRFPRRFGTVVAARVAAGRVAVPGRRRFVRAVVMLLLVLFHLLPALGPPVLEPHLRRHNAITTKGTNQYCNLKKSSSPPRGRTSFFKGSGGGGTVTKKTLYAIIIIV